MASAAVGITTNNNNNDIAHSIDNTQLTYLRSILLVSTEKW